ncbi:MAG: response regulator [Bacteroidota bacterium]
MYHKALQRQINKYLSSATTESPELIPFLELVSNYYATLERDKRLSEHAFEISEKEYQKVVQSLKSQHEINTQSISKIKHLIKALSVGAEFAEDENGESDILVILDFLEKQIQSTKLLEEALIQAKEMAEASTAAKSTFLSTMSHEIRTPLNGVIGFTDLLMKTKLDQVQQQYMSAVHQSAISLLDVINDILDFSKIESGKLELELDQCNIHDITSQVSDIISYQAHQKKLEVLLNIAPDIPAWVLTDTVRLRQILVNLLSNAVKFTHSGEIELKVQPLATGNKNKVKIRFSVRDTGIGIEEKNQQRIFEAFSQADTSTTRKYGGTGLGLAISNRLLALMDSSLQLRSQVGKGSIFYFDIELTELQVEADNTNDYIAIKHVLVVDDNTNNRHILKEMLALKNITADLADNGYEAIGLLMKGNHYDAVLMDFNMPGMTGIDTIKEIRFGDKIKFHQQPVVLLYSSTDDEEITQACRDLDVQQRLVKPIKMQQLFQSLSKIKSAAMDETDIFMQDTTTPERNASLKVLVADDNSVNMFLAKIIVNDVLPNAVVIEAENGAMALQKFKTEQPDLVLMDIQMPEMNGYEASVAIREFEEAGKHVPIIALTAGTLKGEKERCLAAGMDDYISKPVVRDSIANIIDRWLLKAVNNQSNTPEIDTPKQPMHFNKDEIFKQFSFDSNTYNNFIRLLIDNLQTAKKSIVEVDTVAEYEMMVKEAHRIKGIALTSALPHLAYLATSLEYGTADDIELRKSLITQIRDEIELVLNEIKV